jgi:hypothetical protein
MLKTKHSVIHTAQDAYHWAPVRLNVCAMTAGNQHRAREGDLRLAAAATLMSVIPTHAKMAENASNLGATILRLARQQILLLGRIAATVLLGLQMVIVLLVGMTRQ